MRRGRLCAEHRDGLDGALMGMLKFEEILPLKLEEMAREPRKKRRKSHNKSSPVWDTRNVHDYDFIPARLFDNPIYAADQGYQKTLQALPTNLKRAFFDRDWEVFAGQYFDLFDLGRNTARAEEIEWQPWWPRWISIDWGFEHPAATYWHAQAPA
jgi:hypothetical protein